MLDSSDVRMRGASVTIDRQRMDAVIDAPRAGNDQLALSRLEDAFGEPFGESVTLVEIDQPRRPRIGQQWSSAGNGPQVTVRPIGCC